MPYILVGIIPVGGDLKLKEQYPLVQSRCHYNVVDVYTVATVVQEYYSDCSVNRDVEYVFPLPPSAAVCAFKAVLDDIKVIKGIVKEKGEAKKEYDQAVAQGKTAGLLQQEHADVFRVSLGNIKPKQKISVHISFVSIVPHDGSSPQTLRITMPTAIAPRYGVPPTNIPWFGKNFQDRFELTVAVQMSKPVTSVSSPSHPIGLTLGCAQKELQGDFEPSKAFVYLGDSAFLDKDIVIVISAQGLDTPRCSVERWLSSDGAEETTDAYALTLVPKFELPALPSQEYVFLVDRSGSMGTGRMDAVKASLQIMLKSLPSRNTTFNIVSFGSSFTSLWQTSRAYSAESVEEASRHVDSFSSNYGGTELRSALEFAFSSRGAHGKTAAADKVPASVFILTDGEAWDLRSVLDMVSNRVDEAKRNDALLRAFVLGVGNQVSTAMCEGIARAGKGTATFVAEGEKPDAKLMGLLKAARGAAIEDLAVDWGVESESHTSTDSDDDFEMISTPSKKTAAPVAEPALSLFDDSTPTTSTELGPQKVIVNLAPPPVIQQAPKSDKLPIPLYPGFRCSIFAIIKQSANPGPPPSNVRITGKVLGRDVVLQLPVTPIALASNATEDAVEGGRLLHTLAAKALIQDWEDKPTTPETKAEIERLGKRYTLASSVTSFLAIDNDTNNELQSSPAQVEALVDVEEEVVGGNFLTRARCSLKSVSPNQPTPPRRTYGGSGGGGGYGGGGGGYGGGSDGYSGGGYASGGYASSYAGGPAYFGGGGYAAAPAPPPPQSNAGPMGNYYFTPAIPQSTPSAPLATLFTPQLPQNASSAGWNDAPYRSRSGYQVAPAISQSLSSSQSALHYSGLQAQPTGFSSPTAAGGAAPKPRMQMAQQLATARTGLISSTSASVRKHVSMADSSNSERGQRVDSLEDGVATLSLSSNSLQRNISLSAGRDREREGGVLSREKKKGMPGDAFIAAVSMGPLTIEGLARAQNFDGSFPSTQQFISFLSTKGGQAPALPSELSGLVGDESVKASIWATILTLACLQMKFSGDKDAWEMLAEKGKDFVEGALQDLGVGGGDVQKMVGDLTAAAVAAF